jgi:hypothetical protein
MLLESRKKRENALVEKNYESDFQLYFSSCHKITSYSEVGTIILCYVFALLHNALYLWRIDITSDSYRFRLFVGIITSDSYCSELAGQRHRFTSLTL